MSFYCVLVSIVHSYYYYSSVGTSDLINIKQKIAAGQLNATNAINILDDLLSNQLSDGLTSTAAFRMVIGNTWLYYNVCPMSRSTPLCTASCSGNSK